MNKIVLLATKPKRAAPKAKYIDPIVQATFAQDGSIQVVVKALSTRLRDPNTTVVFKALIVVHTMMRSGALDPTFSYLHSSSLALSASGKEAPNITAYASYLAARIKSYGNLKRDVIRDKADRRAADRLRKLGVEQGLLREVREVQRMIASLVESKFYLDDVDDDVSMTGLRLLVKDLLVLFTAVNEGVINVLEHYFEMSHVDATVALKIYKTFCRDTEKVVAYLGIAKKLQNVLNVPIPNLKHAPVSLVKSLEEYLNDPNFESNRGEYKENKRIADGGAPSAKPNGQSSATAGSSTDITAPSSTSTAPKKDTTASFTDFFESIEQSQTSMFDPSTQSPSSSYFQQQAAFNPFLRQQVTGMTFGPPSGMMMPQMTGMGYGAFAVPTSVNPFGQPQYLQAQPTGFIQPQMTGGPNPFRQSMMMTGTGGNSHPFSTPFMQPQATGAFAPSPFAPQQTGFSTHPFTPAAPQQHMLPTGLMKASPFGSTPSQLPQSQSQTNGLPSSIPSSPFTSNAPFAQPLSAQKTGAKNPFNPAPGEVQPPKAPVGPSLNAMAFGGQPNYQSNGFQQQGGQPLPQQPQSQAYQTSNSTKAFTSPFSSIPENNTAPAPLQPVKTGLMGNVASEFALNRQTSPSVPGPAPSSSPFATSSATSAFSVPSSTFSSQSMSSYTAPSSTNSLLPQTTGFGGSTVRPFQPTSSFGSKLADEFGARNSAPLPNSFSHDSSSANGINSQNTGSANGFNPFRSSTLPMNSSSTGSQFNSAFGGSSMQPFQPQPTGSVHPFQPQPTGIASTSPTPFSTSASAFSTQSSGPFSPTSQPNGSSFANSAFGSSTLNGGNNQPNKQFNLI